MLTYKLEKDPFDLDEVLFTGKLNREIPPGVNILTGCNGSGKTTILSYIKDSLKNNEGYKVFYWDGLKDKRTVKDSALQSQNFELLASLSFASEGEEISTNIGVLVNGVGNFVRNNPEKNIVILLDGVDSGLSVDNIIELKDFFKGLLIPDIERSGQECYVIASANEYELAAGERCIDARSGKEMSFADYNEYRKYILDSRKKKDKRQGS